MNDRSIPAESQRVYIDAAVNFRPEGGRSATGFVRDMSMTGMFIGTDTLYLTGTELDFSIRAGTGVIEGAGRVVWQRAAPSSQNLPIGIGVSFDRLDPDSRMLVRHLVDGSENPRPSPEKVEDLRDAVSAGLDASSSWRPVESMSLDTLDRPSVYRAERGRPRKKIGMTVWSLFALVALFGAGLFLQEFFQVKSPAAAPRPASRTAATDAGEGSPLSQVPGATPTTTVEAEAPPTAPEIEPETRLDNQAPETAAASADEPALTTPATAPEPRSTATEPSVAESPMAESTEPTNAVAVTTAAPELAAAAVEAWAAAWSGQDPDTYIGAYVQGYSAGGLSNSAWQEQRRQRLTKPSVVEVEVEELKVRSVGAGAEATFVQRYRSDSYRDVVRKTLRLVQEGGGWKISRETSEPIP